MNEIFLRLLQDDWFKWYLQAPYNPGYDVQIDANTWMYTGTTRSCISISNSNYVIKFCNDGSTPENDPCEREFRFYEEAKKLGLERYFAKCWYAGEFQFEMQWYGWEDIIEVCNPDYTPNWMEIVREKCELKPIHISLRLYGYEKAEWMKDISFCEANVQSRRDPLMFYPEVGAEFLRQYGEKECKRLTQFCVERGIDDLHNGNVGYVDGRIVIFDYAGGSIKWCATKHWD